jgi:hypothetical protein
MRGQLLNAWGWDTFGIGITATGAALLAVGLVFAAALAYELTTRTAPAESRTAPGTVGAPAAA